MTHRTYGLVDPRTGGLRYIGKTSSSLQSRLKGHIRAAQEKGARRHVCSWILGLIQQNKFPEIFEIEESSTETECFEAEIFFIGYFRMIGADLLNHTTGGEGLTGWKHSEATKAKLSAISKGKPRPQHVIDAVVAAHCGSKRTEITRQKMRQAWTEERKISHAIACKARPPMSAEQRDLIGSANRGRKFDPVVVEKRAAKLRGRTHSLEQRMKAGRGVAVAWTPERRMQQAERMRLLRKKT